MYKNSAKEMKTEIKKIIIDIDIVIEAINNNDVKDAISMLEDIQLDLKVIELIA